MAYKDKDKQRQAVKQATRRYRLKLKGITPESVTVVLETVAEAVILGDTPPSVIPCDTPAVIPDVEPEDGTIDIETLVMLDAACGDKLSHGLPANQPEPQSYNPMMAGYVPLELSDGV